jgi:hypothetical protein
MLPVLPYYAVHYQPHPPLLRGTVQRPLSATEFTEACEAVLAWAQHYDCPFWLLDGRADVVQPLDLYEWLREDFLPHAHKVLDRVPYLAFIGESDFWLALQAQHYAPSATWVLSAAYRANWFTTEEAGVAWLAQFRPAIGIA